MKKIKIAFLAAVVSFAALAPVRAVEVSPAIIDGVTWFRGDTDSTLSTLTYVIGSTLCISNITIREGNSITGAVQDLTDVTVTFGVGRVGLTNNVITNATILNATGGTCFVQFPIPDIDNPQIEAKLDGTNVFYYSVKKTFQTRDPIE